MAYCVLRFFVSNPKSCFLTPRPRKGLSKTFKNVICLIQKMWYVEPLGNSDLSDLKTWLLYCNHPLKWKENFNFLAYSSKNGMLLKKATSQKNCTGFSILMAKLFAKEKQKVNFSVNFTGC